MDRSLRSVAAMTKHAEEVAGRVSREAEQGGAAAQKSIQGMGRVRASMEQSAAVIREMGKRSNEIGGIVNTINVIAERTNMLSLNASIEAARAGEAGRGFAVVAEEIRNLADRSAQATADIAAIIKALQEVVQEAVAASNEGVRVAEESGRLAEEGSAGLQRILSGVDETTQIVGQIARATEEQLSAGAHVVTAIETTATQAKQSVGRHRRAGQGRAGDRQGGGADAQDREGSQSGDGRAGPRRARDHQGRAEHDGGRGAGAQSLGRAGGGGQTDRAGGRVHAPRRGLHLARARRAGDGRRAGLERVRSASRA